MLSIISWNDYVLYIGIRTKHSTKQLCHKLQENNDLEYIPQCKSWLLQMHPDGQFTQKHIYGWRENHEKIYNNGKEYIKEACWYFDLYPIIAVWLMKEHAKKSGINLT